MAIKDQVQVGELNVRYTSVGSGPPMVIVPGLGLSARFYERNTTAFAAAGLRVLIPELPGFGSGGAWKGRTVPENARFLRDFASALELPPAIWLGHSIGAQAVLRLAAQDRAGRVRALVLAGPSGDAANHALTRRAAAQAAALMREAFHSPAGIVASVAREYVRVSPIAYIGTWLKAARDEPLVHARTVRCPVLIALGTDDHVSERRFVERLRARLADGRIAWLPGGGHAVPRDSAPAFNGAVLDFLRDALPAA